MSWIDKYKGEGPWTFTKQLDKPHYNEGNLISNKDNPLWKTNFLGNPITPIHHPWCGYWHKKASDADAVAGDIETYIELLSTGLVDPYTMCWATSSGFSEETGPLYDVTYLSTYRDLDTNDYKGTNTYVFEAVCQNRSEVNSGFVYLVDENDNIVATIEVPIQSWGPIGTSSAGGETRADGYWGKDWYTFRAEFIPLAGSHQYGLRVAIANCGWLSGWYANGGIVKVAKATIVIRQVNPISSVVHIPMMVDYNSSIMDSGDISIGFHYTSDGYESIAWNMEVYNETYPDCEVPGDYFSQCRNIWKFQSTELSKVSKVVFDASLGYPGPANVKDSGPVIYGVPDFNRCKAGLYWSTANLGFDQTLPGGSIGDTTLSDSSGNTFTLITGSVATWYYDDDGLDWAVQQNLNEASFLAANNNHIYLISQENVYGGSTPGGPPNCWTVKYSPSIPGGSSFEYLYIHYYTYYDAEQGSGKIFANSLKYQLTATANKAYVALFDKTTGIMVPGSELTWTDPTRWERKNVELSSSVLIDGHEYIARWKTDRTTPAWRSDPHMSDVNLYVFVDDIIAFTSWLRVLHGAVCELLSAVAAYSDWCEVPGVCSIGRGCMNVNSRGKLYRPAGAKTYFELSAWVNYCGGSYTHSNLVDCLYEDNGRGDIVPSARLEWTVDDGYTYRQRTGKLLLTDQHRYVNETIGHYECTGYYFPLAGFLVTKYKI